VSHHYSGPDFGFPRGDARLDFTDLGFSPAESRERAILLYSFLFGQSLLFVEYGPRKFASITDAGTGLLMGPPSEIRTRKETPQRSAGRS
jgi:hypothetical protein